MAELTDRTLPAADPRAVRVRLDPAMAIGDEMVLVLAPGPSRVTGVLAQRHGSGDAVAGDARIVSLDVARHRLDADGVTTQVVLEAERSGRRGVRVREVLVDGFRFEVVVESEHIARLRERATRTRTAEGSSGPLEIRAVIPGRLVSLWVATGEKVAARQRMLAIEAMKMQNELLAPRAGTIGRIGVAVGETVEIGDVLVVIE